MLDSIYGKIDEFLHNRLDSQNLYIQEGSGGYYISSYEGTEISNSKFINRIAQIVDDDGEYKLSIKNQSTGQWGEYAIFSDLDECLEELGHSLNGDLLQGSHLKDTGDNHSSEPSEIRFSCWSCDSVLFSAKSDTSPLYVEWAENLETLEFVCPTCNKAMVYDLSSEKDRSLIFHAGVSGEAVNKVVKPTNTARESGSIDLNINEASQINIDFNDLVWRLKDHSNFSIHYLNLLTGRMERVNTKEFGSKDVIAEYESFPWYRVIPVPSKEAYGIMEDFVVALEEGEAKTDLESAISEPKPFKKFKQLLQQYPSVSDEWVECENNFYKNKATEWLDPVPVNYKFL